MKCPADCPGEQSKEEKKKLKQERQENAKSAAAVGNGAGSDSTSDLPRLSRSDTMNTLSSGYSATAHRSVSGTTLAGSSMAATEEEVPTKKMSTAPPAGRRNRLVAPPPTSFATSDPGIGDSGNGDSLKPGEMRGRMLYAYQQNSEGEVTVADGQDVIVVEADGEFKSKTQEVPG